MDVYLDNAATSFPKAPGVGEAMARYVEQIGASPMRAGHRRALEASRLVFEARSQLAGLVGLRDASRLTFQASATHGLTTAILGSLRPGDHVVTSDMEHNAVWRPLVRSKSKGVEISVVSTVDASDASVVTLIGNAVRQNTRLVVLQHVSNVSGRVLPIAEVGALLAQSNAHFLVDGAQSVGLLPIDVEAMQIDLLCFSGHKGLRGPQGVGAMVVRAGAEPEPLVVGGAGVQSEDERAPTILPERYESGTLPGPAIAGLLAALSHHGRQDPAQYRRLLAARTQALAGGLRHIEGLHLQSPPLGSESVGVVSWTLDGADPARLATVLAEEYDIACRAGLHCAPRAHHALGTYPLGSVRFSPGSHTRDDEIEVAVGAVREIARERRADVAC